MKIPFMVLAFCLLTVTGCQTVPPERKNHCACAWEIPWAGDEGGLA
jgi:hypothetical protein